MEMNPSMVQMEKEFLQEAKNEQKEKEEKDAFISEVTSKTIRKTDTDYTTPKYTMVQDPEVGYPEFLVFEIQLPNQPSMSGVLLDVGEDCLILHANDGKYKLDIDLPFDVDNDNTGAQFHRNTKVLTVTLPVLPKKTS